MTHIRYVNRQLDVRQVMAALSSAKLDAVIEPGGHKAMQPEQGHGRWQVSAVLFEVHPGYRSKESKKRKKPDTLIVQGRRGWTPHILNHAALAIMAAPEGIQNQQKRLPGRANRPEDINRCVRPKILRADGEGS